MRDLVTLSAIFLAANLPIQARATVPALDEIIESRTTLGPRGLVSQNVGRFTQQIADDFTLTHPAQVNSITWWGQVRNESFDDQDFGIRFFADDNGSPSGTPVSFADVVAAVKPTSSTGSLGRPIYEFSADVPRLSLPAGRGWLSVVATGLTDETANFLWWATEDPPADARQGVRFADADPWVVDVGLGPKDRAFVLRGTIVPEPSTLGLLVAALTCVHRRR